MKNLLQKTVAPVELNVEAVLLNSDWRSLIPRRAIKPEALRRYQGYIAAGEATLRLPSGQYQMIVDYKDGNALFHLYREHTPMSIAGVATSAIGSSELWQFLVDMNADISNLPEPEPPRAPPWLALHFLHEFMATADLRMVRQFSALHWSLAWAVVEHATELQRRN